MTLSKYLIGYLLTFLVFLGVDMFWLGFLAKDFYQRYMGHLLSESINWMAAFAFYLLFVAGIFVFVILPAVEKESIWRAVMFGAFFGLVTYSTYDLTNLATLNHFPKTIVWIDLSWGTFVTSLVSATGYWIVSKLA